MRMISERSGDLLVEHFGLIAYDPTRERAGCYVLRASYTQVCLDQHGLQKRVRSGIATATAATVLKLVKARESWD